MPRPATHVSGEKTTPSTLPAPATAPQSEASSSSVSPSAQSEPKFYLIRPSPTGLLPPRVQLLLECDARTKNCADPFEVSVKFLGSLQPLGLLILRVALGLIFLTHGYPKLTRSATTMQGMFVQHGLPAQLVYVAGVLETFGGVLLILGLFARPAALLLAIE